MPTKSPNPTKDSPRNKEIKDAATLRLLQAMGLSAVRVAPGVMALSAVPQNR